MKSNEQYRKRLKLVYELLETGNNKKAIQEVDKIYASSSESSSKKNKNNGNFDDTATIVIAKALKSLALMRTHRQSEGDKLIDELLETNTTDENALNIVMQYCRETQQMFKIVSFYEKAAAKCEQDLKTIGWTDEHEELFTSLFYAYARNRDFSKQQQTALRLYKQTNRMIYSYWNAASYVMMSKADQLGGPINNNTSERADKPSQSANNTKQLIYLQLGEKILQKAFEENKMEFNGEYLLYLNILEERNQYEQALAVVEAFDEEKHASKLGITDFKVKKKLLYFRKLERWADLKELCESYLGDSNDAQLNNWLCYLDYIDSIAYLLEKQEQECDKSIDLKTHALLSKAFEFLDTLKQRTEAKAESKAQGPYLARIELLNRIIGVCETKKSQQVVSQVTSQIESMAKEYLTEYLNIYVSKPGLFYELNYFKSIIRRFDLYDYLLDILKTLHDSNRPFKSVKSIYTCLIYWQLHRHFGKQVSMTHAQLDELAVLLEQMYVEGLEFGKDLLPTTFQFADDFLLLASHIRYDIYKKFTRKTGSSKDLLQLIYNIKQALVYSPSNYQFKLLLLNLYSQIGTYDSLNDMYVSMEIKNIQNYSTANLLLVNNMRLGSFSSSLSTYSTMSAFFTSNLFEMVNFLTNCYKYGTFLKAIDINAFTNTIKRSLTLNVCLTNHACLEAITCHSESSSQQDDEQDFRQLKTKIERHFKDISNCSNAFDKETGLLPEQASELNDVLLDHNDKDVMHRWDPQNDEELANRQYNVIVCEQRKLLKLRSLMLRLLNGYMKLWLCDNDSSSSSSSSDVAKPLDVYMKQLIDFDYAIYLNDGAEPVKVEEEDDSKLFIYTSISSYLHRIVELKQHDLLNSFICLVDKLRDHEAFFVSEQNSELRELRAIKTRVQECFDHFQLKFNELLSIFGENSSDEFRIEKVVQLLESFSSMSETLSFVSNLFGLCLSSHKSFRQLWQEKIKKTKKKKGQYTQYAASMDALFEIYELLCSIISYFYTQLKQTVCNRIGLLTQTKLASIGSVVQFKTPVPAAASLIQLDNISSSYVKSFDDLKSIFAQNLKYILRYAGNSTNLQSMTLDLLKV